MSRIRAVSVVVHDNQLLVMYRIRRGEGFYTLPGGGLEEGETAEQAAVRETLEETSIKVKTDREIYYIEYPQIERYGAQHFFLCHYLSGTVALGEGNEKKINNPDNVYMPMWLDPDQLSYAIFYPEIVKDWLIEDLLTDFKHGHRDKTITELG